MNVMYKNTKNVNSHNLEFLVIKSDDLKEESKKVLLAMKDECWLKNIQSDILREAYLSRARKTSENFERKMKEKEDADDFLTFIGEKIVTINTNKKIEEEYSYDALPLPELWKMKIDGNPGFDFFNKNKIDLYLIFGEGKFIKDKSAYNSAAKQVVEFISSEHDKEELPELSPLVDNKFIENFNNREFTIGFSIPSGIDYNTLFGNFLDNDYVKELLKQFNLYAVGVELV